MAGAPGTALNLPAALIFVRHDRACPPCQTHRRTAWLLLPLNRAADHRHLGAGRRRRGQGTAIPRRRSACRNRPPGRKADLAQTQPSPCCCAGRPAITRGKMARRATKPHPNCSAPPPCGPMTAPASARRKSISSSRPCVCRWKPTPAASSYSPSTGVWHASSEDAPWAERNHHQCASLGCRHCCRIGKRGGMGL